MECARRGPDAGETSQTFLPGRRAVGVSRTVGLPPLGDALKEFTITPKVDEVREFLEIATDFTNPLELVREAIGNSLDANATEVSIEFSTIKELGATYCSFRFTTTDME